MEIDLTDPANFVGGHPLEQYRWLQENAPVYRHPERDGPGFWAVTRAADVRTVGRDADRFSSEPTVMLADPSGPSALGEEHKMMLMADAPLHTALRGLLSGWFTPRGSVRTWQARVDALAVDIVDQVVERGSCDLVEDLAGEMPSRVVAEMFGLDDDLGRHLYRLTETIHSADEAVADGAKEAAVGEMFVHATEVWGRLVGGDEPELDWLREAFVGAEVEGRPFDPIDFALYFLLLVDAGGDTTRNLVGGGFERLLRHPEALDWLRQDLDGRLPTAIEELLRVTSPVVHMRRTATTDTELAGVPISEGDKVVVFYGAANHDPALFERPDELLLDRHPNHHVAFGGGGPHYCLGAHLGRLEIRALLREILSRLEDLELAGEPSWMPSVFISGPTRLPVRFRPAARSESRS